MLRGPGILRRMSDSDQQQPPTGGSARDRLRVVARLGTRVDDDDAESFGDDELSSQLSGPAEQRPRRSPRIAPHAARTATRARRTWFAFLFFPIFAIYTIVDAVRALRSRLDQARGVHLESRPPFRRPAAMPPLEERSVDDVVRVVESFPFRPLKLSTSAAFFRENGPDALGALLSPNPQISTIPHMYPPTFRHRLFTGDQDVRLAGMQAMHEHRGPALIIAHGLLMTKHFDMVIQLARRAYEQWGFHVVTFDMRSWGQSAWTTDPPASGGYHEGRDIIEIARELRRDPRVTSVGGIGLSLGGASMLNAGYVSSKSDDRPLDGGVVAVSPPTMIGPAIDHISTKPHWRDPFFGLWHVFDAAIKSTVRHKGLSRGVRTWKDLVAALSSPYYGITMEEFAERASAVNFAHEIDVPTLVLHAADDFLVTVPNAYALQDATEDNPNVHVMVRDSGAHVSFGAVDASWYHSTLRCWLEYWATPGDARADADDPAEDLDSEVG